MFDDNHSGCPDCSDSKNLHFPENIKFINDEGRLNVPVSCSECDWSGKIRDLIPKSKSTPSMNLKEFSDKGYLQEINRQFLHPLGLAFGILVDDNNEYHFDKIYDYRDDPEGCRFGGMQGERLDKFKNSAKFIKDEMTNRRMTRFKALKYWIQPIEEEKKLDDTSKK